MLKLDNVGFSYGDKKVLENFSLTVENGECVSLQGPSGCGKTTVIKILAGLCKPQSGEVFAPQKVSVVFQEDRLVPMLSVKKNILLPLAADEKEKAIRLLYEIGLKNELGTEIRKLSGGMRRRVAIVRALAFSGDALLLDEPFNGLDGENKRIAAGMILKEAESRNIPILLSTHINEDAELLGSRSFKF